MVFCAYDIHFRRPIYSNWLAFMVRSIGLEACRIYTLSFTTLIC